MQRLHLLAAQGGGISPEDRAKLQSWYETLDCEEAFINRDEREVKTSALKKKIETTSKKIVVVSREVADLLRQNEQIRLENQQLRQSLESRLAEQAV